MRIDMTGMLKTVFMVAILFPIIITQLIGVDTSGWPAALVTVWDNLPIILGLVLLIGFLAFTETGKRVVSRFRR